MADYTSDKKIGELDILTSPATDDYAILGDTSDSGKAKAITWANIRVAIEAFSTYFNKTTAVLDDISNVNAPSPSDGQLLVYETASSSWKPNTSSTPDGSTTVAGKFEEATAAELNAGTATGGTGARLTVTAAGIAASNYATYLPSSGQKDALAGTSGTPGTSNKYITNDDTSSSAASGKIIRANGTALPALSAAALTAIPVTFASGSTTKDLSAASTTQNIAHGLSTTPSRYQVYGVSSNSQQIFAVTINNNSISSGTSPGGSAITPTNSFVLGDTNANYQTATFSANGTNIVITWTKTGSPSGTAYLIWEAIAKA